MDAATVRAFLGALPDQPPGPQAIERVRVCLASLQHPDVRYLVALILGPGAPEIASVARAVLEAAGAPTGILGRGIESIRVRGAALDEPLLATAGTLVAAASYQLPANRPELGELGSREAVVALALTAFAEASQRVALIVDEPIEAGAPAHAPKPDLVALGRITRDAAARALQLIPAGCPVVTAPLEGDLSATIVDRARRQGSPVLLGGRDFTYDADLNGIDLHVGGESYRGLARGGAADPADLVTGIVAALGLGALGIRMREEWVREGAEAAATQRT